MIPAFPSRRAGFSLVELLVAVSVSMLVVAGAMGALVNILRRDAAVTEHMRVVGEGQKMADFLRTSSRLTSLSEMVLFPEEGPHNAISFPLPPPDQQVQNESIGPDGRVDWGETLIIHAWPPDEPVEMRMTRFRPRDNSLSPTERAQQLEDVAKSGGGSATFNAANSFTLTLARVQAEFSVQTEGKGYNFYSETESRDASAFMGGVRLQPGENTVLFRVTGRSDESAGHRIMLDQLYLSPAGLPIEAEALMPPNFQSGASAQVLERPGSNWSGDRAVVFHPGSPGAELEFIFYNDTWHEHRFLGRGTEFENAVTQYRSEPGEAGTWLAPAGRDMTWNVNFQTRGDTEDVEVPLTGAAVRTVIRGEAAGDYLLAAGDGCTVTFQGGNEEGRGMHILHAFISEASSADSPGSSISTSTTRRIRFGDPSAPSDSVWIPPEGQETSVPLDFEIDPEKSYVISYLLGTENSGGQSLLDDVLAPLDEDAFDPGYPAWFEDHEGRQDSFILLADVSPDSSTLQQASWPGASLQSGILGVAEINTTYFNKAVYTSRIIDTTMQAPGINFFDFNAETPDNTDITFYFRSGTLENLADAPDWDVASPLSPSDSMNMTGSRYIQVQARLERDPVHDRVPALRDFTLRWLGPEQFIDIGGAFIRTPSGGIAEVEINGEPPSTSFRADITLTGEKVPFAHSQHDWRLTVETTPRNR